MMKFYLSQNMDARPRPLKNQTSPGPIQTRKGPQPSSCRITPGPSPWFSSQAWPSRLETQGSVKHRDSSPQRSGPCPPRPSYNSPKRTEIQKLLNRLGSSAKTEPEDWKLILTTESCLFLCLVRWLGGTGGYWSLACWSAIYLTLRQYCNTNTHIKVATVSPILQ